MTREELLDKICPTDTREGCYIGRDCDKCYEKLNAYLDEYDKQIRADVIKEITQTLEFEERWLCECYVENGFEYSSKDIDIAFDGIKNYLQILKGE